MSNPHDADTDIHADIDALDINASTHTDTDTETDTETESDLADDEVFDAIERCIEPDSNFSIMQAAAITNDKLLPDKDDKNGNMGGIANMLAEHVLTRAMEIPYNHQSQMKLALYVQCMMQSEKLADYVADDSGKRVKNYKDGFHGPWEHFWWTVREWFSGGGSDQDVNLSAFYARLYGMNVDGWGSDPTYFIWALQNLECDMRTLTPDNKASMIRSAALWVLYSGQFGFDGVVKWPEKFSKRESRDDDRRCHQQGPIYDGPIYGMQRWEFWQRRLEEVRNENLDEETRRLACMAEDMMAALARNSV